MTRTMLATFVLSTSSASSPVRSATAASRPVMPALLMSVSTRPSCASMSAAARAYRHFVRHVDLDEADAERGGGGRAELGSRAPRMTVWPSSVRRRAVS